MNAKIIQIVAVPETEETFASVFALTEDGRVYERLVKPNASWTEILTNDFAHHWRQP
jgi:hypothetical protein